MIKSLKRAISIVMTLVFVVSLMPVVFASTETHPGMFPDATSFKAISTKSGWQRYDVISDQYLGGKGEPYSLWGDSAGAPRREISVATATGAKDVIEMSLYIPSNSQGMSFEIGTYKHTSGYASLPLLVQNDGIYTNFSGGPKKMVSIDGADKWINLAIVSPEPYNDSAASNSNAIEFYVNGVLKKSQGTTYSLAGFRHLRLNARGGTSALDPVMYVDNVRIYSGEYQPQYDVVDEISYVNGIEDGTILTKENITVGELKNGITKKQDTTIRVYKTKDSTQPLEDTEIVKDGYMVVAAAKNGATYERSYNYYTTGKYVKKYPGINNGTTAITTDGSSASLYNMSSVTGNLGGKGDAYLLDADLTAAVRKITLDDATGSQDVFEMSFYVPSNSNGVKLTARFTSLADKSVELPLLIKSDGIYTNWSAGPSKFHTLEPDKWHTFALVSPEPYNDSAAENSNIIKMYINGELIDSRASTTTRTGFRNRISLSTIDNNSTSNPVIYFDNIRVHSLGYEPEYDVLDNIDYVDGIDGNNIIVKKRATVGELKAGITKKEDTTIRVYSSLTSTEVLPDTAYIEDGYVVVAAAKNGSEMERSYNYYTVDKIPNEVIVTTKVNGDQARLYDADDTLSVSASFNNYTNDDAFTAKMYTAQYKYGELIKVWETESQTVAAGENATFTCDFAGIETLENTNIKIMVVNEELEAYCTYETMRYTSTDAKATVYLMGDSIVQTYVDVGYPIQGWGYYIGDYLNDNITVDNRGRSGWTTDHYLYPDGIYTKENGLYPVGTELLNTDGRKKVVGEADRYRCWDNIKSTLKAGDYIMIALAVNDTGSGNVPVDRYMENVETVYEEATAIGATVILLTPTIRGRDWNSTADFRQDYISRGKYFQEVADKHNIVCLPLGAELVKTYNAMVEEYRIENPDATLVEAKNYVRNYFHLYGASSTNPPPGWDNFGTKTEDDDGHYNYVGVNKVASVIAKLLAESDSPLGDYVEIPQ